MPKKFNIDDDIDLIKQKSSNKNDIDDIDSENYNKKKFKK